MMVQEDLIELEKTMT